LNIPFHTGGKGFVHGNDQQAESRQAALETWLEGQEWIAGGKYDLLILDEITYLFYYSWLKVNDFITWIKENKPPELHLVLTGRHAPAELIEFADLVTEMRELKHPFHEQRIPAQKGIDY
jgi:cob(I)alamin adenosyltransferase